MTAGIATSAYLAPTIIAIFGSGGIVAALYTLLRWKGDNRSAAVAQAQGAAEVLQDALEAERELRIYWQKRHENCSRAYRELAELHAQLRRGRVDDGP